ncbi:undecaprenyl-phosphate glucose phosphotransferase [Methylosarcina fibrata]|uniref:undecaprenyl-phosphate glucose phosphotransferase n=1 Tax=Methylosarcina fibrata TaxID=105972 RepID=UPI000370DD01|nr:undecaprenyl-phosphate glucose phosphotransferase [Methylosarcina fibrata]
MGLRGLAKEYAFYLNLIARVIDATLVFVAGYLAYYLKFGLSLLLNSDYSSAVMVQILLTSTLFPFFGVYQSWRGKNLTEQLFTVIKAWGLSFLILIAIGALFKNSEAYSREWLIYWGTYCLVLLLGSKLFIYKVMQSIRKNGSNERRVVYIGSVESIKKMHQRIEHSTWTGFKSVAGVSLYEADRDKKLPIRHVHGLNNLKQAINDCRPDEVWVVTHITDLEIVGKVNSLLHNCTANIRYIPDLSDTKLFNYPSTQFLGMLSWEVSVTPHTESRYLIKWLEDILLGTCIFILLTPLMLLIALGIKITSPGPVLFKQKRHGWNGKIINVYKFRSMHVHQEAEGTVTQATKNDPRVTKFGAFLRRTNLDELPQFFNVLQGRLSIVGPRPHALVHNMEYSEKITEYMRRHKVKPGITGWAQVNGWRGETDTLEKMKNRVECDFYYIHNWSIWLDFKIVLLTVLRSFVDKNAY